MRVVFKYSLKIGEPTIIRLPKDSVPLTVGMDPRNRDGSPAIWVEQEQVDDETPVFDAMVELRPTGSPFETLSRRYVGSIIGHQGLFVWHAYIGDASPWAYRRG